MLIKSRPALKCRVVKKVTDQETFYCLKPVSVVLVLNIPNLDAVVLCLDCARELAMEIIDSTPGARYDQRNLRLALTELRKGKN
jgi:hypothetical protein